MAKESAYFTIENLDDKHDTKKIKSGFEDLKGILSVSVGNKQVCVDFDSTGTSSDKIEKCLIKMGYEITNNILEKHIM
jgi:copper chaperone CopZ